jgi:hypothetical protein
MTKFETVLFEFPSLATCGSNTEIMENGVSNVKS